MIQSLLEGIVVLARVYFQDEETFLEAKKKKCEWVSTKSIPEKQSLENIRM